MHKLIVILFTTLLLTSCGEKEVHPIVVIGGGLMGSSAAWQLAKAGNEVILLEQQDKNYSYGSSLGKSRIVRSLGPKEDIWGWIHDETVKEVKALVKYLNNKESNQPYDINQFYTTSPVTYVRHRKQQTRIDALMYDGQPDKYTYAGSPKEAMTSFGMSIPDSIIVIREYKEHSGTASPEALIPAIHKAITLSDNKVIYKTRVDQISKQGNHYRIDFTSLEKNKGDYLLAKKVVSAAGPWTGPLLKSINPSIDDLLKIQRVFLAFLKIKTDKYNRLNAVQKDQLINGYPLINSSLGTRLGSNFSMIDRYENGQPIIKIGGHFQRSEITDLSTVWQQPLSEEEINWSIDRVHQYLNYLNLPIERSDIEVADTYSCVYTLTNNEVPYISYIVNPDGSINKNMVVMAGLSGVGGKGSLAYGRLAADLIQEIAPAAGMEQLVTDKMGVERLKEDLSLLSE